MSEELANVLSQDGPEEEPQVNAEESAAAEPGNEAGSDVDPQATPTKSEEEPEEQKQKRLGGWQRQIQKLKRDNETLLELVRTRPQAEDKPKPVVDEEEPKLPPVSEFAGTLAEYDKLVAEFPAKYAKYAESKRQANEVKQQAETSIASLNERIEKLPELAEMKKAATEAKMSLRLTNFMIAEAAKKSNGPEVLREALLDAEIRNDLIACDRAQDGQGIASLLNSVSIALRLAGKNSAAPEGAQPKPKPTPITPVKGAGSPATPSLEDMSYRDFVKAREAQLKGK